MSATLDAAGFSSYFGGAPLVSIPSAPRFPVEEIHLEELGDTFDREAGSDLSLSRWRGA